MMTLREAVDSGRVQDTRWSIGLTDAKRIRQIARLIQASNGYREGADVWLGPWIHEILDLTADFPVSLDD